MRKLATINLKIFFSSLCILNLPSRNFRTHKNGNGFTGYFSKAADFPSIGGASDGRDVDRSSSNKKNSQTGSEIAPRKTRPNRKGTSGKLRGRRKRRWKRPAFAHSADVQWRPERGRIGVGAQKPIGGWQSQPIIGGDTGNARQLSNHRLGRARS